MRTWSLEHKRQLFTLALPWAVMRVSISPDCRLVAVGLLDNSIHICDPHTGYVLAKTHGTGHEDPICGLTFASDNRSIFSAGSDNTVILWTFDGHVSLSKTYEGHKVNNKRRITTNTGTKGRIDESTGQSVQCCRIAQESIYQQLRRQWSTALECCFRGSFVSASRP